MEKEFKITQIEKEFWHPTTKQFVFRFGVKHDNGWMEATVGVADTVPEASRYAEAKKLFQAFAAKISAEVAAW